MIYDNIRTICEKKNISGKPFLKPWDFYPDLFKEERQIYEKEEEERQWQEYMEQRREYNAAFNRRIQS